ncbi:MAG: MFS transporter [Anaerolineales bacterium]|nr:MAG: MFS transporter [Anaerolineales bacterium]
MRAFTIIWLGQVVSLLGTAMTQFALTLWVYKVTGQATPLALVGFFFVTPMVILGPFVGTLVDRGNRKLMMMLSDLAAAANTVVILLLFSTGNLQIWHLYITAAIAGIFNGFQWPAFSAAITMMIPKEQYGRANGMLEMAGAASGVFAPILAGALIAPLGIAGIMIIDLVSASAAIVTLFFAHIPQPPKTEEGREGEGGFLKEAAYGFRFIFARPSLLGLQSIFLVGNFFSAIGFSVFAAMILGRTGNDEIIFGSVQTIGAIGGVAGGVLMSAWGGPKRRVHGVLLGWILFSLLGQVVLGFGQSLPVWGIGIFFGALFGPVIKGSNQANWQAKVAPDVQGRVFATRRLIAWLVSPVALLLAGPMADKVMEPAMSAGGNLAPLFGGIIGTGPGAGISLMFVITGFLAAIAGLAGYFFPAIRNVEDILPDHEAVIDNK